MSRIYDNWERLVCAVLRREEDWRLCHAPSITTRASDFSSLSSLADFPLDFSASSSSWHHSQVKSQVNFVLQPEQIFVNKKPLDSWELAVLQSCPNPPRNLKPGSYWYDKYTGFWGKQGYKPSQIISDNLNVGGDIDPKASHGNTSVHINGREITKLELSMLKLVGVKCPRETHFWMNGDGSYQEEAGVPMRGSIWSKAGMKLICSLLSLPYPPKPSPASGDFVKLKEINKILLIGRSASDTNTFFKQAKFLYKGVPFLEDELNYIKFLIRKNLYGCISDTYNYARCSEAFSDWLLNTEQLDFSSTSFIQQFRPVVVELWNHESFQEMLKRKNETLPAYLNYFLTRAIDVFYPNYEPSYMDILYLEDFPSTLSDMNFSFTPPYDGDDIENLDSKLMRYQLITAPKEQFEDDYFCFEMFEDVSIVIFSLSLTDYDQLAVDEHGTHVNKMILNRKFFENVVIRPSLDQKPVLLLLTNYDSFKQKIEQSPLNQCDWLREFNPVTDRGKTGESAIHYISLQFKRLYAAATGRKLYVTEVNCFDKGSVDSAIKYAREIHKWDEEMSTYLPADYSSSSEESLYSEEDVYGE